jgi:hypothetical protein
MQTNQTEMLSSVALLKAEFGSGLNTSVADADLEEFIADLSQYWLQLCSVYSLSTLYTLTEVYNGAGSYVQPLRQYYTSVSNLTIGTCVIPASTAVNIPGYLLDSSGRFLYLRGCYNFCHGVQNVSITGEAGNDGIPGDIQRAFTRHAALEFKRKDSINLKTQSGQSGGSTQFMNESDLPVDILRVIRFHQRLGM